MYVCSYMCLYNIVVVEFKLTLLQLWQHYNTFMSLLNTCWSISRTFGTHFQYGFVPYFSDMLLIPNINNNTSQ